MQRMQPRYALYATQCVTPAPIMCGMGMTGEELRHWRKVRGISQRHLADELGCGKRTIEDWESGRRDGVLVHTHLVELALAELERRLACDGTAAAARTGSDPPQPHRDREDLSPVTRTSSPRQKNAGSDGRPLAAPAAGNGRRSGKTGPPRGQ